MRALRPDEITAGDEVVGLYTLAGLGAPPAVPVTTLNWLRTGPLLVVPPPQGPPVDDPALVRAAAGDLSRLLGGVFGTDLTPYLAAADGFVAPADRAKYGVRAGGERLSWLAVALPGAEPGAATGAGAGAGTGAATATGAGGGWYAQALAVPGDGHLVALLHPLPAGQALDAGAPRYRPLGEPRDLLARLAPAVPVEGHAAQQYPPNVFDAVLTGPGTRVRCGVRRRLGPHGQPAPGDPYCYVLHIDATPPA